MSKMALEHNALNFAQGFPDFDVSETLVSSVQFHMKAGRNQYAPSIGVESLRLQIAKMTKDLYGFCPNAEKEITIFSGATEALYATLTALINPGDEVILFDPAYDCYDPVIRLNGAVPIHINLTDSDFSIPWGKVESKINHRTKAIIINNPHNPTGAVFSREDLQKLEEIAHSNDLLVISDEVYHNMIYDNKNHESVLKFQNLKDRSIAIFSFGKTFHATGWKVGYAIASEAIMKEIRKVHQFVTFSVSTPVQYALSDYLEDRENYLGLSSFFEKKRDLFLSAIAPSRFKPVSCSGTYFQVLRYDELTNKKDMILAEEMTIEKKLASIPLSVFYEDDTDNKLLRFCFAKGEDTIKKAAKILNSL